MSKGCELALPVPPGRRLGPAAPDPAERSPCCGAGATLLPTAQQGRSQC